MIDQSPMAAIVPPNGRGCGDRKKGGIYAECGVGPHGVPVESFIQDPPVRVDAEEFGLSSVGVKLIERDGVHHIVDIVGEEYYPNVADFVEEVRRFGASRRLSSTLDFSKLTADSRLILLHKRAWTDQFDAYAREWEPCQPYTLSFCPKRYESHNGYASMIQRDEDPKESLCCAGFWWNDVDPQKGDDPGGERFFNRHMPSFEYDAFGAPQSLADSRSRGYHLAIFLALPISRLAVVGDGGSEKEMKALEAANQAGIPVEVAEE